VWRKRRRRRFAEEVETSTAAARSTSSTAASCAPISLGGVAAAGRGDGLQRGVCCGGQRLRSRNAGLGRAVGCRVDWGLSPSSRLDATTQ
jgi:hypothetical protein